MNFERRNQKMTVMTGDLRVPSIEKRFSDEKKKKDRHTGREVQLS
jgi:hypothetical protein